MSTPEDNDALIAKNATRPTYNQLGFYLANGDPLTSFESTMVPPVGTLFYHERANEHRSRKYIVKSVLFYFYEPTKTYRCEVHLEDA